MAWLNSGEAKGEYPWACMAPKEAYESPVAEGDGDSENTDIPYVKWALCTILKAGCHYHHGKNFKSDLQ